MAWAKSHAQLLPSICLLLLSGHLGYATSLSFFHNFSDHTTFRPDDLRFEGVAYASNSSVILAKERLTGDITSKAGRVSYNHPVHLWSNATGEVTGFSASFSVVINGCKTPSDNGGGLAFFLAPFPSRMPLNSGGGYLGLFNSTTAAGMEASRGEQIVALELDTHGDLGWDTTMSPHIGIDLNTIVSENYMVADDLADGVPKIVQIDYSDVTKDLVVTLRDFMASTSLTLKTNVDLRRFLPQEVAIGFSATTGDSNRALHQVLWWSFNTTTNHSIDMTQLISAPDVPGTLAIADPPTHTDTEPNCCATAVQRNRSVTGLVVSTVLFLVTVLVVALLCTLKRMTCGVVDMLIRRRMPCGVVVMLTSVFWVLCYVLEYWVFVKSVEGITVLNRLRHRKIVKLERWSSKDDQNLLVYEPMSNVSLRDHLYNAGKPLTWPMRYNIVLGTGSALEYLHSRRRPVLHRNIRTDNVMLDESFNPKLGGFGLARQADGVPGSHAAYMDPDYFVTGVASTASDVYSFGVLLLEIATAQPPRLVPTDLSASFLVGHVWKFYEEGAILDAADKRLNGEFDERQMERVILVGLWCAHPDRWQRPSISEAMKFLRLESPAPNLPPRVPVPVRVAEDGHRWAGPRTKP